AAASAHGFSGADEFVSALLTSGEADDEARRRSVGFAMSEADMTGVYNLAERAQEALAEGDEALRQDVADFLVQTDPRMAELAGEGGGQSRIDRELAELETGRERTEAERDNPLGRKNLLKWIKDHGGLSYRKVQSGFGSLGKTNTANEARALLDRGLPPGAWRKESPAGLDEAAAEMKAEGIPVEDGDHLYRLLMGEDAPQLSAYDVIYQEGYAARRADERAALEKKRGEAKKKKARGRVIAMETQEYFKAKTEDIKNTARHLLGTKNAEEAADPRPYIRMAEKYGDLADKALRERNEEDFRRYKEMQLLNRQIAREAVKSKREEDTMLNFLRKYANRPARQSFGVSPRYLEQLDAMLERFDLRRKVPRAEGEAETPVPNLEKFAAEMEAAGEPIFIPDRILNANFRKHWSKMTLEELRDLYSAAKNIEYVGKNQGRFLRSAHSQSIDQTVYGIVKKIKEYYKVKGASEFLADPEKRTKQEKLFQNPQDFLDSLEAAEFLVRALDGYEDLGEAHQAIFQPIRDALARETLTLNETFAKVSKLVMDVFGTDNPRFKEMTIDLDIPVWDVEGKQTGGKKSLSRDQFIAALLNLGNEGNRQRARDGWFRYAVGKDAADTRAIREAYLQKLLDRATEQDMKFVQGLWDIAESLRPLVKETHEIMTGVTPEWVEARPLVTKFGTFRGGYWPIVTDTRYSKRAARQEELSQLMGTIHLDHLAGATKSGHRKERADNVFESPPALDIGIVDRHLMTVIHDAALAPAVRDVSRIIHHPMFQDAVKRALGDNKNHALNHWVRAVAGNNRNNGIAKDSQDRMIGKWQQGIVMMGMGMNLAGAVIQTTGYIPLAGKIGPLRTIRAMFRGMAFPRETYELAFSKSAFMREQINGQDRDVRRMAEKWTMNGRGKLDAVRGLMLSQYAFFQNLCNIPGWAESYNLGLKKFGADETKAVSYADMVIRTTQGSGSIADLTMFETSGNWKKIFTMFYSWFRVQANLNREFYRRIVHEPGGLHKLGLFINCALSVNILPRLVERIIRAQGPDEGEEWPRWLLREAAAGMFLSPVESIPVVRDLAAGAEAWMRYRGRGGGYRFTPLSAAMESAARLIGNAVSEGYDVIAYDDYGIEDVDWVQIARDSSHFAGYTYGLPVLQAEKWLNAFMDSVNDEEAFLSSALRIISGKRRND
ncbi:MAG: hypothetical protein LBR87_08365, partial [Synergistaceae bacterium]|nr:hypothetical protein [Synergistaceae bacterium]